MTWPDDYLIPGIKPYHQEDAGIIYCADCREILPHLPKMDVVLTDPPYGVGLNIKKRCIKMSKHGQNRYQDINDNPEYIENIVVPIIQQLRDNTERIVLTPGSYCLFLYPSPEALWCIHYPNGAGIGRWKSFTCWQPILCYGSSPPLQGCYPDTFVVTEQSDKNGHPCPKPVKLWKKILNRISILNNTILDPFLGSGTTAVAAKELGRKFIGIEISEEYCAIAVKRLRQKVFNFEETA